MSFAVYYSRLEWLARSRIGEGDASTTSTAEIANALSTSMDEAVHIYEAYNRRPSREFDFHKKSAPFENPSYHRLVIQRSAVAQKR